MNDKIIGTALIEYLNNKENVKMLFKKHMDEWKGYYNKVYFHEGIKGLERRTHDYTDIRDSLRLILNQNITYEEYVYISSIFKPMVFESTKKHAERINKKYEYKNEYDLEYPFICPECGHRGCNNLNYCEDCGSREYKIIDCLECERSNHNSYNICGNCKHAG